MSDKESHVTKFGGVNHTDDLPLKSPSTIYPQIICTIYPPKIAREDLTLKLPSTIYLPPSNSPILSKISNAHNIMLCFTKVFSAKDQSVKWSILTEAQKILVALSGQQTLVELHARSF